MVVRVHGLLDSSNWYVQSVIEKYLGSTTNNLLVIPDLLVTTRFEFVDEVKKSQQSLHSIEGFIVFKYWFYSSPELSGFLYSKKCYLNCMITRWKMSQDLLRVDLETFSCV